MKLTGEIVFQTIGDAKKKGTCINDRILNYLQYGLGRVNNHPYRPKFTELEIAWLYDKYLDVRSEMAAKGVIAVKNKHGQNNRTLVSNPITIAASLLYIMGKKFRGNSFTQSEVGKIFGISSVTIRGAYLVLVEFFEGKIVWGHLQLE